MFDIITIKSKESNGLSIHPGFLAECLMFYKTVNFLANKNSFVEIFAFCGLEEIIELLRMGRLNLMIKKDIIGTSMFRLPGAETYDVQNLSDSKFDKEKFIIEQLTGNVNEGLLKKYFSELMTFISVQTYDKSIIDEINGDLQDSLFLAQAIHSLIKFWHPEAQLTLNDVTAKYFQVGEFGPFKTHKLETNINLTAYPKLSPSNIILSIAEARGNIHLAGRFNSEIADKPFYSIIIKNKVETFIQKFNKSQQEISFFQELVLADCKPIGQVIANKDKSFKEFIDILHKADKFREWLQNVNEDKSIISEYYKAATEKTWVDKLPSKACRFAIFTGAGIFLDALLPEKMGTVAGIALGVGDAFLLDKLLHKWKPNQFIDDTLKGFIKVDNP